MGQFEIKHVEEVFPGGVNSPVRSMSSVGVAPLFVERAQGPYVYDIEGNEYIDFIGSWGAMLLGHAHPKVVEAVQQQAVKGFSYGISSPLEYKLAKLVQDFFPSLEMMRFVNSGTEATMSCVRLAKGFTKRDHVVKFIGCYHGHVDSLMVQAGSGLLTHSAPSSAGVDADIAQKTLLADFNDLASVQKLFDENADKIAAVIIEPVAGNMNMILPTADFLTGVRQLCDQSGALLIFDEVMTGFRVHPGGAQALYGITPDLTALGKIIGGGMPTACYGGRKELMRQISPLGKVYQAGTLSGNPMAMASGIATLTEVKKVNYLALEQRIRSFLNSWQEIAHAHQWPFSFVVKGGMFGFVFSDVYPENFAKVSQLSNKHFAAFYQMALGQGIYFAPSLFEAGFISEAHTPEVLADTLKKLKKVHAALSANSAEVCC